MNFDGHSDGMDLPSVDGQTGVRKLAISFGQGVFIEKKVRVSVVYFARVRDKGVGGRARFREVEVAFTQVEGEKGP